MQTDKLNGLSAAQVVTASAFSTSFIDLGVARAIFDGEDLYASFSPAAAITPATATTGSTIVDFRVMAASHAIADASGTSVTISIAVPGVVTMAAHGFKSGQAIVLQSTGTLPTGLAKGTIYFVKVVDANTFNLATTIENMAAGTLITTTGSAGTGHTLIAVDQLGATGYVNTLDMQLAAINSIANAAPPAFVVCPKPQPASIGRRYVYGYYAVLGGPLTGVSAFNANITLNIGESRKYYPGGFVVA